MTATRSIRIPDQGGSSAGCARGGDGPEVRRAHTLTLTFLFLSFLVFSCLSHVFLMSFSSCLSCLFLSFHVYVLMIITLNIVVMQLELLNPNNAPNARALRACRPPHCVLAVPSRSSQALSYTKPECIPLAYPPPLSPLSFLLLFGGVHRWVLYIGMPLFFIAVLTPFMPVSTKDRRRGGRHQAGNNGFR